MHRFSNLYGFYLNCLLIKNYQKATCSYIHVFDHRWGQMLSTPGQTQQQLSLLD